MRKVQVSRGPVRESGEALPCPSPLGGDNVRALGVACSSFTWGIWWNDRKEELLGVLV